MKRLNLFSKNLDILLHNNCPYFNTKDYKDFGIYYGGWFHDRYYACMYHSCAIFISECKDLIDKSTLNFCKSLLVEKNPNNVNIAYEIFQSISKDVFKKRQLIDNHGNYHKYDKDKNLKHLNKKNILW